jgi:type I restriction enzyme, S subunit
MKSAVTNIDVNPVYWTEVIRLLGQYVPEFDVWAFGSRVKWTAKSHSDLDLAIITSKPLSLNRFAELREVFDESVLPFRVDIVDWAATSESFRRIIEHDKLIVQFGQTGHILSTQFPVFALEECLEALIDYRGKTPEKTSSGIPLVTEKVVKGGRIEPPTEFIAPGDYDLWMRRGLPKRGDVVMTTEAPLGEVAQLGDEKVALAQWVITLRGKSGFLDNTYLLYLLQTEDMQEQLKARATGTTVLGIKQSELRKISVRVPPFGLQISIAGILKSLDDRITLLRETNATLEAIAQALFKSWFVDFDPVRAKQEGRAPEGMRDAIAALFPDSFEESELGLVPKGWRVVRLDSFVELAYGKALKAENRKAGPVPVYGSGGITGWHDQALVEQPAIIVGRKGTVGSLYWESRPFFPIDTVFYVKSRKPLTYCYLLLNTLGLDSMNTDAAVPGLNRENVYRLLVTEPPESILAVFDSVTSVLRASMDENESKAQTLAALRDTLLPRLISGALRLPGAEALIEESIA